MHIEVMQSSSQEFLTILDPFPDMVFPLISGNAISLVQYHINFMSFHGLPLSIIADMGAKFKYQFPSESAKLHKIEFNFMISKNSDSNAPLEQFHSILLGN